MNTWRCRLAGVRAAMRAAILEAEARAARDRIETAGLGTPVGRRDYAILLLLVVYGLRAREVASLTLDSID